MNPSFAGESNKINSACQIDYKSLLKGINYWRYQLETVCQSWTNKHIYLSNIMKIEVQFKGKTISVLIDQNDTLVMLKKQLQNESKVPLVQQEISYKAGDKKTTLSDDSLPYNQLNVPEGVTLNLKDLGRQVRWDYVFYIQYAGPLIIFPLFYLLGDRENYTQMQCWALVMAVLHYAKREYETAFVHVFSRYSMPFKRIFINSIHYWVFFGLLNAIELYVFPSGHTYSQTTFAILFACWLFFQFCNYKCHMILSSFRKTKQKSDGQENASKKRGIPYGWGFDKVSCANYFWEALGWLTFCIVTRSITASIFTALSLYQMTEWAIKKHVAYKKEFGDKYPKGRKAMYPFIL